MFFAIRASFAKLSLRFMQEVALLVLVLVLVLVVVVVVVVVAVVIAVAAAAFQLSTQQKESA